MAVFEGAGQAVSSPLDDVTSGAIDLIEAAAPPGYAGTWTQLLDGYPEVAKAFLEKLGYSDLLGILAVDPNGVGVHMSAPLPRVTRLSKRSQERWQMLGAHIASAYRLRLALSERGAHSQIGATGLPHDAEAVFDVNGFRVIDAVGPAKEASVASLLREADPCEALETWKALVNGRWSLVDWFDSDGRRFFLAIPNPPDLRDPRGLTEQERQVVTYVLLGETNKLGVNTRTQLVRKLGPLGVSKPADDAESVS